MALINSPLLNGEIYSHTVNEWSVSWESSLGYRHWCHQIKNPTWANLLVIMFNPGSLSGDGSNLSKDTTLRILREVCGDANLNPFIVNLFDLASPSPIYVFDNWQKRDAEALVFDKLPLEAFKYFILAYGDYENLGRQDDDIRMRQIALLERIKSITEIELPKNKSGTPKHPMIWQRQKIKHQITSILRQSMRKK
jgi:hypothetical protein